MNYNYIIISLILVIIYLFTFKKEMFQVLSHIELAIKDLEMKKENEIKNIEESLKENHFFYDKFNNTFTNEGITKKRRDTEKIKIKYNKAIDILNKSIA